ncbi:restriction endonuclease PLD domain-containing protein [Poritiphilus flavus]|uniref:NgoFVII family restriction endonuclease n=1 Tax=Poritiphilus flavus TaxID=2697053 RepID=A0A6L9EG09_9FLAO|nr:phospholipase D family protein [Poritiphilus flavus]NAS13677.1 NgoFVII family restriction endonuclease [Poritiphilus flavus]
MNVRFLGQGYNRDVGSSVAQALIDAFGNDSFHTFKCLVAFASHTGVSGLRDHVENSKQHINSFRVIVGVDQNGTSKEALESLIDWGVDTFVFYTSQRIIFHPKIYLFEGNNEVLVIIGSNNLTQMGLVQNIEGSVEITFNKNDVEGENLLEQITSYFDPILTGESVNLEQLTNELIEQLVAANIVKTEAVRRAQYHKAANEQNDENQGEIPNIREIFPSIPLQGLPDAFTPIRQARRGAGEANQEQDVENNPNDELGNLVWRKSNLPGSDVQFAPPGTNPTGGLRLVQARYEVRGQRIDQTTYFRNQIFVGENWNVANQNPFREVAVVDFRIIIQGRNVGTFALNLRHKPSGEAGQNNYTTLISWGDASDSIQAVDLRGMTLDLHSPIADNQPFTINIY